MKISNGTILNLPFPVKNLYLKFDLRVFWALSFILITMLLGFYIFQINALISESYLVQSYQKKTSGLLEGNRILEINLAKINYLEKIRTKSEELGLERIDTINYIHIIDTSVAAAAKQP